MAHTPFRPRVELLMNELEARVCEFLECTSQKCTRTLGRQTVSLAKRDTKEALSSSTYSYTKPGAISLAKSRTHNWITRNITKRERKQHGVAHHSLLMADRSILAPNFEDFRRHKIYKEGSQLWHKRFHRELLLAVVSNTEDDGTTHWANIARWMDYPDVKCLETYWNVDHNGKIQRNLESGDMLTRDNARWTHSEVFMWMWAREKGERLPELAIRLPRHSERAVQAFHHFHASACQLSRQDVRLQIWRRREQEHPKKRLAAAKARAAATWPADSGAVKTDTSYAAVTTAEIRTKTGESQATEGVGRAARNIDISIEC